MNVEIEHIYNPIYREIENLLENNAYERLAPFFINFIQNHRFFSSKALAVEFLQSKFDVNRKKSAGEDLELFNINKVRIAKRIGKIAHYCKKLKIIILYNRNNYKIIDVNKTKIEKLKEYFILGEENDE